MNTDKFISSSTTTYDVNEDTDDNVSDDDYDDNDDDDDGDDNKINYTEK